ncbi:MAG: delta-60 repeat domain-containing protein [Verrucomicrobia bacterium]|nr:delta-60 repeat domain-containing protein [Verrucomicrobiota bacterium]
MVSADTEPFIQQSANPDCSASCSVAPDGKIAICGAFKTVGGVSRNGLARLHADGTLDESFVPNGLTNEVVALTAMGDQRVIVATSRYPMLGKPPNRIVALSPIGTVEATLNFDTVLESAGFNTNANIDHSALRSDNRPFRKSPCRAMTGCS